MVLQLTHLSPAALQPQFWILQRSQKSEASLGLQFGIAENCPRSGESNVAMLT